MTKQLFGQFVLTGMMLLGAFGPAQASQITWTLDDVRFSDGAIAAGSFTYDADTHIGSAFSVLIGAGNLPALTYSDANAGFYSGGGFGPNNFVLMVDDGSRYFNFSFINALMNAGGTQALNLNGNTYECNNCGTFRIAVSGSVTALQAADVPEPAALWLALLALALAVLFRRRVEHQSA